MNSRDAAYDESLKAIMEATAIEAARDTKRSSASVSGSVNGHGDANDDQQPAPSASTPGPGAGPSTEALNGRKKRKRTEEDAFLYVP